MKNTDYDTKISEIENKVSDHNHDKYITTPARVFNARLAQANLVTKTDVDTKLQSLKKINSNKAKHLLSETEFKKLEKFDAAYFRGKNYFDGDGAQNYSVFQSMHEYFEWISGVDGKIYSWESKRFSNEKITYILKSSKNQPPNIAYSNARIALLFSGDPLKQNNVT